MVHCNNCTADINAWMKTYLEFCGLVGVEMDEDALYAMLLQKSMCGDMDCGGITVIGYLAGEHVTDFATGCPLVLRGSASRFTLANFLRAQMNSAFASLAVGMRILRRENVSISRITAHGSFFKTPERWSSISGGRRERAGGRDGEHGGKRRLRHGASDGVPLANGTLEKRWKTIWTTACFADAGVPCSRPARKA